MLSDTHHQHQQPPGAGSDYNPNNPGPTTIHIPLSGNKANNSSQQQQAGNALPEVNRTTVWQQVNKDGISEQLIIPVTVKVRQINGNHTSTNAGNNIPPVPRLSPMHEADEYNETPTSTIRPQQPSNCKEATAKLEGSVVTTNQTPASITLV